MKLTKNTVRILVVFMTVALAGLAFLQVRLFINNVELKHEAFRQNVISALNAAASKLEEIDLRDRFFTLQTEGPIQFKRPSDTPYYSKVVVTSEPPKPDTVTRRISFTSFNNTLSTKIEGDMLTYDLSRSQKVRVALFDVLGRLDTVLVDMKIREGAHTVKLPDDRGIKILKIEADSAAVVHRWEGKAGTGYAVGTSNDSLENIVLRVAETFKSGHLPPPVRRLREGLVDSVLKEQLVRSGINLPVTFAVIGIPQDSLLFGDAAVSRNSDSTQSYATMLFAGDFSGSAGELVVQFPTYGAYLFFEFLPELLLNILFLAVVIGAFWFTVRILVRQKEFAGRLSDFINNMTHEFKTPLSTIALASEALHRPDVLQSKTKIRRYNRIIGEEYARMRGQVDKILDMAALEEGDVEFHRSTVDIHALILRTAEHASLEISSRGGSLTTDLKASKTTVLADAIHLENVLRNVLDNAVKYSARVPEIAISTENTHDAILLRVSDRGIGIPRDYQLRVFEKYFRVPTGNIHDVKGFGLGLSYVKLVTEAHGGKVTLESEAGKGTTIALRLPVTEQ